MVRYSVLIHANNYLSEVEDLMKRDMLFWKITPEYRLMPKNCDSIPDTIEYENCDEAKSSAEFKKNICERIQYEIDRFPLISERSLGELSEATFFGKNNLNFIIEENTSGTYMIFIIRSILLESKVRIICEMMEPDNTDSCRFIKEFHY